jgi:GR25 family glycosyltransferase involved in LPS biosynthesis
LTKNSVIKNFKIENHELDIYIPEMNLAIEFNGLYWHSELFKDKNYHYNKWKLCQDNTIRLVTICEDDWNLKQDIVKSIIKNKLGVNQNKIYARKCQIKEIKSTKEFLDNNHLQGWCQSSVNLGLFYNNELVSLMTFGKKRMIMKGKSQENEYELLRFCNKLDTSVVGGASKLFKYFIDNYKPEQVISYANLDISNGNLYDKLGFKLEKYTGINYWWAKDGVKYHRSNFMKHKNVDPDKEGYYKIYGTGNLKYKIEVPNILF